MYLLKFIFTCELLLLFLQVPSLLNLNLTSPLGPVNPALRQRLNLDDLHLDHPLLDLIHLLSYVISQVAVVKDMWPLMSITTRRMGFQSGVLLTLSLMSTSFTSILFISFQKKLRKGGKIRLSIKR